MADFALWATAAETAFGWPSGTFMTAYQGNRESANEVALAGFQDRLVAIFSGLLSGDAFACDGRLSEDGSIAEMAPEWMMDCAVRRTPGADGYHPEP
jgi:hypothetical protein